MIQPKSSEIPLSPTEKELLSTRIADLQLSIKGTRLEPLLNQLYQELESAGLGNFKPEAYLSDEWGCPAGVPVIGVPFYLANPTLCALECQFTGIEPENDMEIMMYLRHEAGHAFNYAFNLYKLAEWTEIFGDYSLPYKETYGVVPFSSKFVRHIPGWYAQKHPDDDFAETFAVWLTPGLDWQKVYSGTAALKKLVHTNELAKRYGPKSFIVSERVLDKPVEEMSMTLDTWYQTYRQHSHRKIINSPILDEDLRRAFPDIAGDPAAELIGQDKTALLYEINNWTGLEKHILSELLEDLLFRMNALELKIGPDKKESAFKTLTIIATTLAMNYIDRGKFIE